MAPSLSRLHDHTQTHHTRYDSSGRVISPLQRPLPDNIQHSHETDIHAFGGIRTHDPSKRAAANPSLRPRGHWDRRVDKHRGKLVRVIIRTVIHSSFYVLNFVLPRMQTKFLPKLFAQRKRLARAWSNPSIVVSP
jgi:hypothetical protein